MRHVAHMQDQVGGDHLFQGGTEGGDQMGRQLGNESHRVAEDDLAAGRQPYGAHGGVQRGKQQVFGDNLDRKSDGEGRSGSVRVSVGGGRIMQKNTQQKNNM